MRFQRPLYEGRLVDRPNRFLARVRIGDRVERAHVHDPGRLTELLVPGARVGLRRGGPGRKTRHDVMLVRKGKVWVSIYSSLPNRLVAEALERGELPEFGRGLVFRSEVRDGPSRIDFLITAPRRLWLEVKSVNLVLHRTALFPDAPTERGRRHVEHLVRRCSSGDAAALLFVVQRADADSVRPHMHRDPRFAAALKRARTAGLTLLARRCRVSPAGVRLAEPIPVRL